jgi:integrase
MAYLFKRGSIYYVKFYVAGKQKEKSLGTGVYQIAKEKQRLFESARARGESLPMPTRTPIADIVTAYVAHIRATKTAKSAQTDIYYLRDVFGPICDALKITSRKASEKARKRPLKIDVDRRHKAPVIEADCFEAITTAQIVEFVSGQVARRGLAPKTANRYREILTRLFNWATEQKGVWLPGERNPASKVERYRESAPNIRFLTLKQIEAQLEALADNLKLQAMVATLIFAGLRREELLWLTHDDLDLDTGKHGLIRVRAKEIHGEFWEPKTKKNRAVPVSSRLRHYLDKWQLKMDKCKGSWIFPSPEGKRWDPDNFSQDLRAANESAKLPWGSLDFRHTFGSHLAMKGESLYKISKLMGNSPEICARHYAALIPEEMGDSVEFGPTKTPATILSHAVTVRA